MSVVLHTNAGSDYPDFLRDESRVAGSADSISFPQSAEEVAETIGLLNGKCVPVTIQGARTGITAGAVPYGGHVLNMSRMDRITGLRYDEGTGDFFISVEPGLTLEKLRLALSGRKFDTAGWSRSSLAALGMLEGSDAVFFPPDPTETSASIGGMVACNASGACSYKYGAVRGYVERLHLVLADGDGLLLERGVRGQKADKRSFSLMTAKGRSIVGMLPGYIMPDVKNASGYYAKDGMHMLDLFVGSEGTLGIATEMELRLVKKPASVWGLMAFFPDEGCALDFVRAIRGGTVEGDIIPVKSKPAAIEFFNCDALELLRMMKHGNQAFSGITDIPGDYHTAVYIEYHGEDNDTTGDMVMEASDVLTACGGSEETTWIASGPKELEKLKLFRHAVPEAVNLLVDQKRRSDPEVVKLGTDMAVPDSRLMETMAMYRERLLEEKLESVIFGHIGNNHVHVNVLPNNAEEYRRGKLIYREWAAAVAGMGGSVSAEHGIGKLKTSFLDIMYGKDGVEEMLRVKKLFDPQLLLNRGNLFDY